MTHNTPDNDLFHHHFHTLVGGFREHISRRVPSSEEIRNHILHEARQIVNGTADPSPLITTSNGQPIVTVREYMNSFLNNPDPPQITPQTSAHDQLLTVEESLSYMDQVYNRILAEYDTGTTQTGQGFMVVGIGHRIDNTSPQPAVPPAVNTTKLLDDNVYYAPPSDEDKEKCGICLAEYGGTAFHPQVLFKICKHRFHRDCAKEWLNTSATCPCCRAKLDV